MNARPGLALLKRLARSYGIQEWYVDSGGQRRYASPEALQAALGAVGAPAGSAQDALEALSARSSALWQRLVEPVAAAWEGRASALAVRLTEGELAAPVRVSVRLEKGGERVWETPGSALQVEAQETVGGRRMLEALLPPLSGLSPGYHRLGVETASRTAEALLVSAPPLAYGAYARFPWAAFLPLHALHSRRSWGVGDLGDLEALMTWVKREGGSFVGILPIMASFLDEPQVWGPYAPVSRIMWNEVFLDVERVPGLADCRPAQEVIASTAFQELLQRCRRDRLVDYPLVADLKRRVLEPLAQSYFSAPPERRAALTAFLHANPLVEEYAGFRAAHARLGRPWQQWPSPMRQGSLQPGDWDGDAYRYHQYVQWLMHRQLEESGARGGAAEGALYLDLPLGVHRQGFDAWRYQELFAQGVSIGAPPDPLALEGQDWGIPPLLPERMREQRYDYFIASLRCHMRFAGALRMDHIMGLHRTFWVPEGMGAKEGVYVRYPAEELYTILCLESHRSQTLLVGEDLGTVPAVARRAMARRGLHRMYVAQFELRDDRERGLNPVPYGAVASVNTHDTPTLAGFWRGRDVADRRERGITPAGDAQAELAARQKTLAATLAQLRSAGYAPNTGDDLSDALAGLLRYISASDASLVLVNLEDLWLEEAQQNVPATTTEHPNWRRKARYALEEIIALPQVRDALVRIRR